MASRSTSELNTEQTISTLNEILELELVAVFQREAAVHARHQGGIDNEIGPRRAAHGLQGSR